MHEDVSWNPNGFSGPANYKLWLRRVSPSQRIPTTERYERLRQLAAQIMAEHAAVEASHVEGLFSEQVGYATPKVDVRGAVFKEGRVLLVRERSDSGRWTLPGGWADVNRSPRECVVTEVREEAGLEVKPIKLAAVYDRSRHPYVPPYSFHIYKMFFICEILSGVPSPGMETDRVDFFEADKLPELSVSRVLDYRSLACLLMLRHLTCRLSSIDGLAGEAVTGKDGITTSNVSSALPPCAVTGIPGKTFGSKSPS